MRTTKELYQKIGETIIYTVVSMQGRAKHSHLADAIDKLIADIPNTKSASEYATKRVSVLARDGIVKMGTHGWEKI